MQAVIYTVTAFQKISRSQINENEYLPDFGEKRCIGWFPTFEEANCAVTLSFEDIHDIEGDYLYDYVIIEKMDPGIFTVDSERYLYKWNNNLNAYERIEEPVELNLVSNFGIG